VKSEECFFFARTSDLYWPSVANSSISGGVCKNDFYGQDVKCFGGAPVCRVGYPSQLVRPLAHCRSKYFASIYAGKPPGLQTVPRCAWGGRTHPRFRCRVARCLPEGPNRLSLNLTFQHSPPLPPLHDFHLLSQKKTNKNSYLCLRY
jgi:hypothetical protein